MSETIYLDTCALNRLADDHSQPRVRREAEAVLGILDLIAAGKVAWIASTVLHFEIERMPDAIRRIDTLHLLSNAAQTAKPTTATFTSAAEFQVGGLSRFDALHLAIALETGVDSLLTTDDRFLNLVTRLNLSRPEVVNPVDWIERRHPWLLPKPPSSAK